MTEGLTIVFGDTATITCAVTDNTLAPDSISWSYSGNQISDNDFYQQNDDTYTSELVIKNVNVSTPHDYSCSMTFDQDIFEIEAEITTYGFELEDVFGIVGESIVLPCIFKSDSSDVASAKIQIKKSGDSEWTSMDDSIFSTSGNTTIANYTISTASTTDDTEYRCLVTDTDNIGFVSDTFDVDIVGRS